MRLARFEIENFNGIKSAALDLLPADGNVFTLIGLNEGGKTAILETLYGFGAIREGMEALRGAMRVAEFDLNGASSSSSNLATLVTHMAGDVSFCGGLDKVGWVPITFMRPVHEPGT